MTRFTAVLLTGVLSFGCTVVGDMPMPTLTLEIAPGDSWNTASPTWVDITADLREGWTLNIGRDISDARPRPSTLTLTLDNSSRDYDPENAAGPYFGDLVPLMQIRLRATHNTVTYDRFRGFVLAWPNTVLDHGKAVVALVAYDGLTQLQRLKLRSVWEQEVRADSPRAWYRFSERVLGTAVTDSSGNGYHAAASGDLTFGLSGPIVGANDRAVNFGGTQSEVDPPQSARLTGASWTVEAIFRTISSTDDGLDFFIQMAPSTTLSLAAPYISFGVASGSFKLNFQYADGTSVTDLLLSAAPVNDGEWHHALVRNDGSTIRLYLDGVLEDSGPAMTLPDQVYDLYVGYNPRLERWDEGDLSELIWYGSDLGAARVTDHYDAMTAPWESQTTSARITAILDEAGWPVGLRDLDTGLSTMVAAEPAGKSALEAILEAAETEDGQLWINGAGDLVFRNRLARSTSTIDDTYSDDGSDIKIFDHEWTRDDLELFTVAQVTDSEGEVYEVTAASSASYADRVISRLTATESESEPFDYVDWLAGRFGVSRTRFERLVARAFSGSSNARWAAMLSRDLGDLLNVEVNPKGGGAAIDDDWFVEQISLTGDAGMYEMTMQLSPADGQRMWVLGDSTLSVLGSTTVLGW